MLVQEVLQIPRDFDGVRALVSADLTVTLNQTFAAAYRDGEQLCLRLAPTCQTPPSGNKVWVDIGNPYPRGNGVVIPVHSWAVGAAHFFPRLDADLELMPVGGRSTQIRLMGRYDPPLGYPAMGLEQPLLRKLAEASISAFVNRLGEVLQPS